MEDAKNMGEACEYILKGVKYCFMKHPKMTAIVMMFLFGSALYILYDHILPRKVEIGEAKPISMVQTISLFPQAIAQEKKLDRPNPVYFDSKKYGFSLFGWEDTNFVCKMLKNENQIIVFDKRSREVYRIKFYGSDLKEEIRQEKK